MTVDEGSFEEFDAEVRAVDPLGFPEYADKIARARVKCEMIDSILTGYARIADQPVIVGVADFSFMGGSMGSVVGEKIVRALERAQKERLPVVMITANGGGARMQEGLFSLMQMAKTSAALAQLMAAGIPYIAVLTDPTMAGVYASYASLGDIIFAEPGALIGFAGRRVGNQDMGVKLPDDFQTAEFQARCGMIDSVVHRKEMRNALGKTLRFFAEAPYTRRNSLPEPPRPIANPLDFEKPILELDKLIEELKQVSADPDVRAETPQIDQEIAAVEAQQEAMIRQTFAGLTPWNEVQMARHPDRPYTLDYIGLLCEEFVELHGDRTNADDPAIVGGIARFGDRSVFVLGHQKGRNLKERQLRNFGSARPAGFRKALRIMKMAERFNKPLLIFVDTPAAEANLPAEEEGISTTIAVCLREMSVLRVPILVAVIGEGGSGGALGIAIGDCVLMLEHAIYSVIPPEGCAAILWNDRNRAAEAAEALKLTAKHACEFGLIDEVLPEPSGGAHRNPAAMAQTLDSAFRRHLETLDALSPEALLQKRYARFRNMGRWEEPDAPAL
jgi:acetyl-CoA carboxylase carboxyl transferase alpha subunit/acetyl-CoA carboxylase carboxyl transferase beta subunit